MQEYLKNCYIDDLVVTKEDDPTVKVEAHLPEAKNVKIATITVGNSQTKIFAPKADSSGSIVSIDDTLPAGTKIATLTIDGNSTEINAPNPGSTVTVNQTLQTGTKIATLTIDNTPTTIFAPNPGSNVKIDQKLTNGKEIATIKVDDKTPVSIYSPYFENKDIDLKTLADCANAIKKLLMLLGIDESKIHTV